MAPHWTKKDIESLLLSVNTHNTFETASREALFSKFSPSQCKEKFNELFNKPWMTEDNLQLEKMINLVYSNPCMASVNLGRPMGAIQKQVKELEWSKRPPMCRFIITKEEKVQQETAIKPILIGLDVEREILEQLMMGTESIMLFGPEGSGKKSLLNEVAAQNGLKTKFLSREFKRFRNKKEYLCDFFGKLSQCIVVIDDDALKEYGELLYEFCGAGGRKRIVGTINYPMDFNPTLVKNLFTRRLRVCLPHPDTRTKLLSTFLSEKEINICDDVDLQTWAKLLYGHTFKEIQIMTDIVSTFRLKEIDSVDSISPSTLRRVTVEDFRNAIDMVPRRTSLLDLLRLKNWGDETISEKKREESRKRG